MLKTIAIIFGVLFLLIGVLGFIPAASPNGNLFGIFHVNTGHNIIPLIVGIIALWVGFTSEHASHIFFRVFGIIFGILTILGFIYGDRDILGYIANNTANNILHLIFAAIFLYLGFGCCCESCANTKK